MAFRVSVAIGEGCDRCNKQMTEENPGIQIYVSTRESGRNIVWIHMKCLEWGVLHKASRLLRERKEILARTEPKAEATA